MGDDVAWERDFTALTAWFERYRDLSIDEAQRLAAAERRQVRVIAAGGAFTLDASPERLNIFVRPDGSLDRLSPG